MFVANCGGTNRGRSAINVNFLFFYFPLFSFLYNGGKHRMIINYLNATALYFTPPGDPSHPTQSTYSTTVLHSTLACYGMLLSPMSDIFLFDPHNIV